MKDKNFYNRESKHYSSKRYPEVADSYIQFFFKKRLALVLDILQDNFRHQSGLSLIEIGCADGVVLREIKKSLPQIFSHMVGIDTAEEMIGEAKVLSFDENLDFFVRGEEDKTKQYNCVLEIGVANYGEIEEELQDAKRKISDDGLFILSLAGKGSINSWREKGDGYKNFWRYADYEKLIKNYFEIKKIIPVGINLPFIWRCPVIARIFQEVAEKLFRLSPNLYHEKTYILKKKEN